MTIRDGLWLAAALILHAGLFLIPISENTSTNEPEDVLMVELQLVRPEKLQQLEEESPPELPSPAEQTEPESPDTPPEPAPEERVLVQESVEDTMESEPVKPPRNTLTTAILLQSAADLEWPEEQAESNRKLGVAAPQSVPQNWLPGISLEPNRFDGMTVPRKVEVLDRWVSSDGSRNVVLNTPTGDTLCGRGLAWDPMQPLVEHVMQFQLCGGGGKRTFKMPDRYHKNADNRSVVNSTTN